MLTTPRLVAIALCAALNFAIGNVVYLVKLPIYLDSIGTILCALLIFPDRLAAIACAFIAGFIAAILTGLMLNPFLPWFTLTVLSIAHRFRVADRRSRPTRSARARCPSRASSARSSCAAWSPALFPPSSRRRLSSICSAASPGAAARLWSRSSSRPASSSSNSALFAGLATDPIDKTLQVLLAALLYRATPREFIAMLAPAKTSAA